MLTAAARSPAVAPSAGFIATGETPSGGIVTAASTLFRSSTTAGVRSNSLTVPRICARFSTRLMPRLIATCCVTISIARSICAITYWLASWMTRLRSPNTRRDSAIRSCRSFSRARICSGVSLARSLAKLRQDRADATCSFCASSFSFCRRADELLVGLLEGGGGAHHVSHRQHADDGGRRGRPFRQRRHLGRRRQLHLTCGCPSAPGTAPSGHEAGTRASAWLRRGRRTRRCRPRGRSAWLVRDEPLLVLLRARSAMCKPTERRAAKAAHAKRRYETLEPRTEAESEDLRLVVRLLYHERRQVNV